MFKISKGEYGYIGKQRIRQLLFTVLMAVIAISIYIIGYIASGNKRSDICLVLAILMVLPGAKFLVSAIVLFPYKTPSKESYEEIKNMLNKKVPEKDRGEIWSDLVFTSPEKVMNLNFLYIGNECVYGELGKEKQDIRYIQDYLTKGIRNWGSNYKVKVCKTHDEYLKILKTVERKEKQEEEEKNVIAYLRSLIV